MANETVHTLLDQRLKVFKDEMKKELAITESADAQRKSL